MGVSVSTGVMAKEDRRRTTRMLRGILVLGGRGRGRLGQGDIVPEGENGPQHFMFWKVPIIAR